MKLYKKGPVLEARLLECSTTVRAEIVAWIGPDASDGPDGGIFIRHQNGRLYIPTGKYLVKEDGGNITIVDTYKELTENYAIEC